MVLLPRLHATTGGLIRESRLLEDQAEFDRAAWLASHGIAPALGERVVTLFCYDNPVLPDVLSSLSQTPCLLLAAPGDAAEHLTTLLGPEMRLGALRAQLLPLLTQTEFDRLLWASDLNFVRGEDSFVRAQWAGRPFVWQIYPQHDLAHAAKMDSFLDLYLASASLEIAADTRAFWRAWNGLQAWPQQGLDIWRLAEKHRPLVRRWREQLLAQSDLSTQLLTFISKTR